MPAKVSSRRSRSSPKSPDILASVVHHNFSPLPTPKDFDRSQLSAHELHGLERGEKFVREGEQRPSGQGFLISPFSLTSLPADYPGHAYAQEHGTRPATIGLVLSSSPIALLSWVGEKFLAWTDEDLPIDTVLEDLTLYWLTDTISTSFYAYRNVSFSPLVSADTFADRCSYMQMNREYSIRKPFGYSSFPEEIIGTPRAWLEQTSDLVFYREHKKVTPLLNDVAGVVC